MRQECLGPSLGARDARKILARRRFERSPSKGLKSRCRAQRRHEAPLSDEPNMIESLAQKKCTPCRGGIPPLTHDEAERFRSQTPNWELRDDGHRIERTFRFRNFQEALNFVRDVGNLAEAEAHHHDVSFGWGYATISLRTKKIKGLHENDFILASKIDRMFGRPDALPDR